MPYVGGVLNAPQRSGSSQWWFLVSLESLLFPQEHHLAKVRT